MDYVYNDYKKLEKEVLDSYDKELQKQGLILERNIWIKEKHIEIDGLVKNKKGNPLVVIEIKSNFNEENIDEILLRLTKISNSVNCRFMILANKNINILYYLDRENNLYENKNRAYENIKELIKSEKKEELLEKLKIEIKNKKISKISKIVEKIENKLKNNVFSLVKINDLFRMSNNFIKIEDNKYSFNKSIENKIFKEIFEGVVNNKGKIKRVCRYTTFETLFSIIKNKTFRMNGICGMNDKTEINYVENYIYEGQKELDITKSNKDREKINNTFITSCCKEENIDNLTQWRLYADDAKGVCLVFELNNDKVKNFLFGEIIYEEEKLNILRKIIQIVKEVAPNSMFVFKNISSYKHFVKPPDYEVEEEIRLVYIYDKSKKIRKDWLIAQPFNIINPYIEFNLLDKDVKFPLILKEVILGPKCLEKDINKIQLETLLKEKGFNDVEVRNSNIKHYR